jgi:hypothetical protein
VNDDGSEIVLNWGGARSKAPVAELEKAIEPPEYCMKPGPELDALIAEKVIGWKKRGIEWVHPTELNNCGQPKRMAYSEDVVVGAYDPGEYTEKAWSPSTDIAAAWEVVEKLRLIWRPLYQDFGFHASIRMWFEPDPGTKPNPSRSAWYPHRVDQWHVDWVDTRDGISIGLLAHAPTLPHAICLAALRALGVEV